MTALDGINPINAGKKRDEALALLKKFFPGLEDFDKQERKYKREIKRLETDKTDLFQGKLITVTHLTPILSSEEWVKLNVKLSISYMMCL